MSNPKTYVKIPLAERGIRRKIISAFGSAGKGAQLLSVTNDLNNRGERTGVVLHLSPDPLSRSQIAALNGVFADCNAASKIKIVPRGADIDVEPAISPTDWQSRGDSASATIGEVVSDHVTRGLVAMLPQRKCTIIG